MIKHIVMWRFKETEKQEKAKALLEGLPEAIPVIRDFQVGINTKPSDAAADLVLVSAFDTWSDLDHYQRHPAHLAVADYLKTVVSERRVADYEVT